MKRLIAIAAGLALAACSPAPTAPENTATPAAAPADPKETRNTSFTDKAGVRTIQLSALIPASQEDVFTAIATVEGWKTWAVPAAFGSAEPGAYFETSYDPNAKPGDPGNITQEFLIVLPPRLVAIRTIKTPEGFPNAEDYYKTTTIMELAAEGGETRLTLSHTGFAAGPGFDQLYGFFEQGDAATLEQLRKRFETGPIDWSKQQ